MQYDIRFPAATQATAVAAALDVCYQVPASLIKINQDVDPADVLVIITDSPASNGYSVRLRARNETFTGKVRRHSDLAVALRLSRHLLIPAILRGPGLDPARWWLAKPDGDHQIVGLDAAAMTRGEYIVKST